MVKWKLVPQSGAFSCCSDSPASRVSWTQSIQHRDLERMEISQLGLRSLWFSLKAFFLVLGEARIVIDKNKVYEVLAQELGRKDKV